MKSKEEKIIRKVLNVKRKLTSLESVRNKTKEMKQQSVEVLKLKYRKKKELKKMLFKSLNSIN